MILGGAMRLADAQETYHEVLFVAHRLIISGGEDGRRDVSKLEADIRWHEEQLRLARAALRDADRPDNSTRNVEVEALKISIHKFEKTLEHLSQLRATNG